MSNAPKNRKSEGPPPSSNTVEEEYEQGNDTPVDASPDVKIVEPPAPPKWEPPVDGIRRFPIAFARFEKMINFAGASEGHVTCQPAPLENGVSYVGYVLPELQSVQVFRFTNATLVMSRLVPFTRLDEYALA